MLTQVLNIGAGNDSYSISATSTSASVSCHTRDSANNDCFRIVNYGSKIAFVKWGNSKDGTVTITASTTDTPILPNTEITVYVGNSDTLAAICGGTDTTTIYFSNVQGI